MKKMNISKRIKKVVLTATMMATMAMTVTTTAFASDGSKSGRLPAGQEEPAHYHQPGWIAKEPTCTEPGLLQDICPYHPDYVWSEEEIPALGHDMGEWIIVKEPTYNEEGLKVRDCSRGDLHEEEVIPKLEHVHSYGEWVVTKEATCSTDGEAERVCDCGDKEVKSIAATGHDYKVTEDIKATCESNGRHVETCENCGDEIVTTTEATGHDYVVTEDIKATCESDGRHVETCENCGDEIVTTTEATGHDMSDWYVVKEATYTENGIEERVCSRGDVVEQREIPMLEKPETTDDTPDEEPDVLSEYIPEDNNTDDVVNNEPDVLSEYIPQTGDTSNVFIYVVMLLGALLVLVAATRKEEQ